MAIDIEAIRDWQERQRSARNEQTGEYLRVFKKTIVSCEYDHEGADRYIEMLTAEVEDLQRQLNSAKDDN